MTLKDNIWKIPVHSDCYLLIPKKCKQYLQKKGYSVIACHLHHAGVSLGLIFNPEVEIDISLRNVFAEFSEITRRYISETRKYHPYENLNLQEYNLIAWRREWGFETSRISNLSRSKIVSIQVC
jgi:hypothetical protein